MSDSRSALQHILSTVWLEEAGRKELASQAHQNILRQPVNDSDMEWPSAQQSPAQVSPGKEKREVLQLQHPIGWLTLRNTCDPFSKSMYFQFLLTTNESVVSGDGLIL